MHKANESVTASRFRSGPGRDCWSIIRGSCPDRLGGWLALPLVTTLLLAVATTASTQTRLPERGYGQSATPGNGYSVPRHAPGTDLNFSPPAPLPPQYYSPPPPPYYRPPQLQTRPGDAFADPPRDYPTPPRQYPNPSRNWPQNNDRGFRP